MTLTFDDLLSLPGARGYNIEGMGQRTFKGVSTDSRTTKQGEIFFAIRGERLDGHEFVGRAFENGALIAVIHTPQSIDMFKTHPLLLVEDSTKALGKLAKNYRRKFDIPIIAVAGSNGKSTTKDMIAAVLGKKYNVLKTEGNLNNHIGVPHTLFRLQQKHDLAVIEIGTNHFGELSYLCEILEPTHGLITNVGREHLEFFGDVKGAAKAEGELYESLGRSGIGFINADDPWVVRKAKVVKRKVTYGFAKTNVHIRGRFLGINDRARAAFSAKVKGKREFNIQLSVPGKHAASCALGAAAVGIQFNVAQRKIQQALRGFTSASKRMETMSTGGITILNDTYNANPDSVLAALETMSAMRCRGKKIVVLADMLELGAHAREEHRGIGTRIGDSGAEYLLTCGHLAKFIHDESDIPLKFHYDEKNILSEYLSELVSPGDIVLVKGSRRMRMEDVVTFLVERFEQGKRVTRQSVRSRQSLELPVS